MPVTHKRVLIVTHSQDIHADLVAMKIAAKDEKVFRLNLDEFPAHFEFDIKFARGEWSGALLHKPSGEILPIKAVGAVWARKSADFMFANQDLTPQERAFAVDEATHALSGFLYSLHCYWMSHPRAVRSALWKGEQLQRAARMGFRVPDSLVSNSPDSVRRFKAANRHDIIFKTLSSPFLGADKVDARNRIACGLATTRVTEEHDEIIDAVSELPCLFQEHVVKQHELRVTIVGYSVFAAKIHSQDDDRTKTDYRDFSAPVRYEAAHLPKKIEQLCVGFVHSYGLNFGAMDFIVTPCGDYVFLENNPGGQFLFIEQLVPELSITNAVAQRLVDGARSSG